MTDMVTDNTVFEELVGKQDEIIVFVVKIPLWLFKPLPCYAVTKQANCILCSSYFGNKPAAWHL